MVSPDEKRNTQHLTIYVSEHLHILPFLCRKLKGLNYNSFFAYLCYCVAFHYSHHHFKNNKREFNLLLIYYKIADSKSVSE